MGNVRNVFANFVQTLSGQLLQYALLILIFCGLVLRRGRMFHQWVSGISAGSGGMKYLGSFVSHAGRWQGILLYLAHSLLSDHTKLDHLIPSGLGHACSSMIKPRSLASQPHHPGRWALSHHYLLHLPLR